MIFKESTSHSEIFKHQIQLNFIKSPTLSPQLCYSKVYVQFVTQRSFYIIL